MTAPTSRTQILVYSDDSTVRASIVAALGRRVSADLSEHDILEFATGPALRTFIDRRGLDGKCRADLFILDGESVPEGGMGICRQLKDEVFECPPALVITGRADDAWLATWSRADGILTHPIDPFTMANTVAGLLRSRSMTSA
jgi:DNA-binding response OmpR family regulator